MKTEWKKDEAVSTAFRHLVLSLCHRNLVVHLLDVRFLALVVVVALAGCISAPRPARS